MQSHLEQCRQNMVEHQVRPWDVLDDKVLETLNQVPRDHYVPDQYRNLAYADTAIPLNATQFMMHPVVEGRLLQALDIQPDDAILEIGTGSGYLTACMAHLGNQVDSIEIDEALAKSAETKLQQQGVNNVSLSCGNGLEVAADKRYDVIAVTGSVGEIPSQLKEALNINGRMFIVDGEAPAMQAHLITRTGDNDWADQVLFETVLETLVHGEKPASFEF